MVANIHIWIGSALMLLEMAAVATGSMPAATAGARDAEAMQASGKSVDRPALRRELLRRKEKDQAIRQELIDTGFDDPDKEIVQRMLKLDRENTEWLKQRIEALGRWPGTALVGEDGAKAAWLLAQHAPGMEAKELFLRHLERAVDEGRAPGKHYAYLYDRVCLGKGHKQLYGTQWSTGEEGLELRPLAQPETVDQRRRKLGMPPIAERHRQMREYYKLDGSGKQ